MEKSDYPIESIEIVQKYNASCLCTRKFVMERICAEWWWCFENNDDLINWHASLM